MRHDGGLAVSVRSIASGMHAALLLARGRTDGLRYVESDTRRRRAQLLGHGDLPARFVCLRLLAWAAGRAGHAGARLRAGPAVLRAWAGWASRCCRARLVDGDRDACRAGRASSRCGTGATSSSTCCWWLAAVPGLLGAPVAGGGGRMLVAIGWALWLEWFAIKLALEVSVLAALALVGLDLTIGLALTALGQGLQGG